MNGKTTKPSRSRNALVHGLYARDVLLPWDSKEEFEKLHQDLRAEFSPRGRSEEETILDLAFLYWQKQTLWRMRQAAVLKDAFTADIVDTKRKSWSGLRKALRAAAKDSHTLVGSVQAEYVEMVKRATRLESKMEEASDPQEIKLLEEKVGALHRTAAEHLFPLIQKLSQLPDAEKAFDNVYSPDNEEKIVRLETLIDARVAKVLARLVGLKEFKRTPAGGAPQTALPNSPKSS